MLFHKKPDKAVDPHRKRRNAAKRGEADNGKLLFILLFYDILFYGGGAGVFTAA